MPGDRAADQRDQKMNLELRVQVIGSAIRH
jgi:hypothetical protein